MASVEKDDLDDSSSSGDVIIEHWSEGDSDDVICVDSSVDKPQEVKVQNDDGVSDSDSDDCIILEKESSIGKLDDGPPTLDCDSFEDFKRVTEELVTSTPKHGNNVIVDQAEQVSQITVLGESSEDKDDTDSSDDNFVIIGDVTDCDLAATKDASEMVQEAPVVEQSGSDNKKSGTVEAVTEISDDKSNNVKACVLVEANNNVDLSGKRPNENHPTVENRRIIKEVEVVENSPVVCTKEKVKINDVKNLEVVAEHSEKNNNAKKRISDAKSGSVPVTKKPCFVFGSTAVLSTPEITVSVREEVSLSEQLAMSSEEEQESLEEEEEGGEFWLKMITGASSGSVVKDAKQSNPSEDVTSDEKKQVKSQAWSAEEEVKPVIHTVRKSPTRSKKNLTESKLKVGVENEEHSEDDDEISLAPSLEMFSDDNNEGEEENNNNIEDGGESDDDIGLAIYSLGNYCKSILRGVLCSKPKCSWVHYMDPADAVTQFYRICSNRSVGAVVRFYRFFTNMDVQAQMVIDAQELLARTDPGEVIDIDPKQVCRDVFKAMVKVSKGLDLSIDQYMEMVDVSSSLYTIMDGKDMLVSLFHQTSALLTNAGLLPEGERLVKWSWTSLYINSLDNGVVLTAQFYADICTLLASHKMIPELVEVLLYTALVPSLTPPLVSLAEVLTSPLAVPLSAVIFTAQTLSRLCTSDWVALSKLGDIKPGTALLVTNLKNEDPAFVYKFYDSLPEIPGLVIPNIPPPAPTDLDYWMRQKLAEGKWEEVAYHFCSIEQKEMEAISDFAEKILLELSQLCGQYQLMDPIPALFAAMLPVVTSRESEVHTQFFKQLGVALLICLVTTTQWGEAGALVKLLANQLNTDFLAVKPPALSQFSGLDRGMVPLFVLEVLVWTKQKLELVKYLELWDCLASMETELEQEKRNTILTSVLECLAAGNSDTVSLDIMIRVSDVMVLGMRTETNVVIRKRQEVISNILFQLMLNMNLPGSRLWSRYRMVRSCNHQLDKGVTKGIVMMLSYSRMQLQATAVYQSAVKWGVYSVQATSRPLTLRLTSSLTLEEIYVIVTEFLARMETELLKESLNIFMKVEETSNPNTGIKHLNCVRSSKSEAMARVEKVLKMLEPPLGLTQASVPYISDQLVRRYFVYKQQV